MYTARHTHTHTHELCRVQKIFEHSKVLCGRKETVQRKNDALENGIRRGCMVGDTWKT